MSTKSQKKDVVTSVFQYILLEFQTSLLTEHLRVKALYIFLQNVFVSTLLLHHSMFKATIFITLTVSLLV